MITDKTQQNIVLLSSISSAKLDVRIDAKINVRNSVEFYTAGRIRQRKWNLSNNIEKL